MWNCYIAKLDTMADAILLGSIRLRAALNDEVRAAFKDAMQQAFAITLKDSTGLDVEGYIEMPGPDHERGGNA